MPFCRAVSASSDSPTPSSRTSIRSLSWSRRAVMSMWPAPDLPRDAVLDRVLDERLQQQRRYQRVECLGLDVVADHQTVGEACAFDLEVLAEKVELGVERDFLFAEPLEREPQQVAEPHQRAIGGVDVAVHQRGDRVQRVEEKMRMQLLLQRLELRLHEPGLQL